MNNQNDDKLMKLYNLAEITYEQNLQKLGFNEENLYPIHWYEIKCYKEKIEIMSEAIKTNNLIKNTSKYENLINNLKDKKYTKQKNHR